VEAVVVVETEDECGEGFEKCGKPCEVYSRVVGYLRPVDMWNRGKRQEFKDRVVYGSVKP